MKIKFTKDFIKQFGVKVENIDNGNIEINVNADFMVFLNEQEVIAATNFRKEDKFDDTLPVKDLLIDQLQYVDYLQKSHGTNLIEYKFNKDIKKEVQ